MALRLQPIVIIDDDEAIMIGDDSEDEIEILEYGELRAFNFSSSLAAMRWSYMH